MGQSILRFISVGLIAPVLAGMAGPAFGEAPAVTTPQIMILVFDNDRLTEPAIAEAERQMTAIFRRAGISVAWRNCSLPSEGSEKACHQIPGPTQFVVTIVARSMQPVQDVFGVAFLDEKGTGKYADIFFDRIVSLRRTGGADQARLLGAVAAHEVGHMLLGSHSHSPWGIMSRHWEADHLNRLDRGGLSFTPEQATRMQARLRESSL
jgi:hypothetical protein